MSFYHIETKFRMRLVKKKSVNYKHTQCNWIAIDDVCFAIRRRPLPWFMMVRARNASSTNCFSTRSSPSHCRSSCSVGFSRVECNWLMQMSRRLFNIFANLINSLMKYLWSSHCFARLFVIAGIQLVWWNILKVNWHYLWKVPSWLWPWVTILKDQRFNIQVKQNNINGP